MGLEIVKDSIPLAKCVMVGSLTGGHHALRVTAPYNIRGVGGQE